MTLPTRLAELRAKYKDDTEALALIDAVEAAVAECSAWREAKPLNRVSLIDSPIYRAKINTDAALARLGGGE